MKGLPFVLLFTAMTFVAWGAYGPVLHHGAIALEHDSLRAFVGVGLAYFMIAVIIPFFILRKGKEKGNWTVMGAVYSLIAGAVGAIGALGIILALGYGGQTVYVMPLVFGFAPVVNTLVTALLSRTFNQISPIFIGGIITAALGAGGVLVFKPSPQPVKPVVTTVAEPAAETEPTPQPTDAGTEEKPSQEQSSQEQSSQETPSQETPSAAAEAGTGSDAAATPAEKEQAEKADPAAEPSAEVPASNDGPPAAIAESTAVGEAAAELYTVRKPTLDAPQNADAGKASTAVATPRTLNVWGVIFSIVIAALCWGSYGPMLHIGQGKMNGSRLRPFTCVGLAYFFIAVAAPIAMIYTRSGDTGAWTASGMTWSFLAGVAGAIGALGVILAFNAGGKPYYVMPLIFGFAPVINTFISLSEAGTWSLVTPMFWISLAVVIAGAVTVLTNAPKPKPQATAKSH